MRAAAVICLMQIFSQTIQHYIWLWRKVYCGEKLKSVPACLSFQLCIGRWNIFLNQWYKVNDFYVTDAFEIVEHILLSRIIDIDERSTDYDATTPLFWAIKENQCRMVEILLDFGASDVSLNVYGDTAVFTAVYYRQVNILKLLVERGCGCNYQSKYHLWDAKRCHNLRPVVVTRFATGLFYFRFLFW